MCYVYAVLAKFDPHHPERATVYNLDIIARYDWKGLHFPLKNIKTFECANPMWFSTRELPPQGAFKNSLALEDINNVEYEHARNVWPTFDYRNLKDCANTYLRCVIALLTEVFEQFRDTPLVG